MPNEEYFSERPNLIPVIYAYEHPSVPEQKGYLKIGYTVKKTPQERVEQIEETGGVPYRICGTWPAMRNDGTCFTDHQVHTVLKKRGFPRQHYGNDHHEWYRCTVDDVAAAVVAVKTGTENVENRTQTFQMRPEQKAAVDKTIAYYDSVKKEHSGKTPRFLWNAKMRFGKTFASYELAKTMGLKRILILTFKPAVQSAWREDLMTHVDFEGWQFISRPDSSGEPSTDEQYKKADKSKPIVCFGSFQDFLGIDKKTGGIKANNEWVHTTNWDLVIFDEYHYGAWRDNAKKLFEQDDEERDYDFDAEEYKKSEADNAYDETWLPITADYYLYLSGTPFRALNSGEFIEEQVFPWTYSDEQHAKESWTGPNNPYASLPRMIMMTYRVPESIQEIAKKGEFDEFDLNVFFSAEGSEEDAHFVYEDYVQKWLDLIRGSYLETTVDDLKLGAEKPPMPFSDTRLLNVLSHTIWFLPNVASCYAMANLLKQKQNVFYHDYKINVCAGNKAGTGVAALGPVLESMEDPLNSKTITLTCGKLMTGVTVRPWTGIFMLRNLSSPETYFQAAFRVQSPWEVIDDNGEKEIIKKECYVFDFALNRALKQISDYSCELNVSESNPEKKVGDFIKFLPVLAYDGSAMLPVDAAEILDIAMAGTSATLLAKRWESALLVNVDNETLSRLLANEDAMKALMNIEGFRNLNSDIETIINKSESVKKAKKDNRDLLPKEKKQLTEDEKEYKSKRKMIRDKLTKFATRIPIFMYLTDYRETALKDVITQLEPGLFKKVTGLTTKDFELLVSLNVFNEGLMNQAVWQFKRYEDASLTYTGIDKHAGEDVGLFSTVISQADYDAMTGQLDDSMKVESYSEEDNFNSSAFYNMDEKLMDEDDDTNWSDSDSKAAEAKAVPAESSTSNKRTYRSGSTYKPAYVPPKPSASTPQKKQTITVDTSGVKAGTIVYHKAFGIGRVKGIDGSKIVVTFKGTDKKFGFPGAFEQGFLSLDIPDTEGM